MPYVGKQPLAGAFKKLDSITPAATATFALQYNGTAYAPASAEVLIVSVNGVTQAPGNAYNVNGTNIIFTSTLSASDVIDYIVALGDVGNATVPVDGSVTTNKISNNILRGGAAHIRINPTSLTVDTTINSNENGLVAGPFTVDTGITLTVNGTFTVA